MPRSNSKPPPAKRNLKRRGHSITSRGLKANDVCRLKQLEAEKVRLLISINTRAVHWHWSLPIGAGNEGLSTS